MVDRIELVEEETVNTLILKLSMSIFYTFSTKSIRDGLRIVTFLLLFILVLMMTIQV